MSEARCSELSEPNFRHDLPNALKLPAVRRILVAIVDARNATQAFASVVEDEFYDVKWHLELSHAGGSGSSEVM